MIDANYKAALLLLLDGIQKGTAKPEIVLHVCQTPPLLVAVAQLPNLPLVISGKVVDKVFFEHGITKSVLERLADLATNPKAIFTQDPKHPPGCVVVTQLEIRNLPVVIAIHQEAQIGRTMAANQIASIFPKSGGDFQTRWQQDGRLRWKK